MPGDLTLTLAGEELVLMPERAIFRPSRAGGAGGTLYVADTHWGKAATFRAAGVAVPPGGTAADLARLSSALERTGAERLVVLGDLLHARLGRNEAATNAALAAWRERHANLRIELVQGNHDRAAGAPDPAWRIATLPDPTPDPPFVLKHVPAPDPAGPVLAGHEHPAVRLAGPGGERLKLPCFRLAGEDGAGATLTLPAFSAFADGGGVRAVAGEKFWAIAEDEVLPVPMRKGSGGGSEVFAEAVRKSLSWER
ncbi:ligase-associated DNA damage response endonuclease PdeM [Alienimonas sp. DA493]|uniref:ligase-associated DNA damage response endonuclease PdeM n=1 Tax=Alienimonas sp. DA493 TaxID=3373605 RepID=UPI003754D3E1